MTLTDVSETVLLKNSLSALNGAIPGDSIRFILNTDLFSYVSPSLMQTLGYSEYEFSHAFSRHFSELVWHEDRSRVLAALDKSTKKISCTFRIQCKNKQLKWMSMTGAASKTADGQTDITAILEDINDQKKMEQKLKQNTDEMQNILNSVSGGTASFEILPDRLKLIYLSQDSSSLSGYTRQELYAFYAKNETESLFMPTDYERLLKTVQESISNSSVVRENVRIRKKDGGYAWIAMHGKASDSQDGKQLFKAVYYSLSAEDDIYHSILRKTDQKFAVLDSDTHEILFANAACEKFSTDPAQKACGSLCYKFIMHNDKPCDQCPLLSEDFKDNAYNDFISEGKHYRSIFSRIEWNGRNAVLVYIVDNSEAYRFQQYINNIISNIPVGFTSFRIEKNDMIREYISTGLEGVLAILILKPLQTEWSIFLQECIQMTAAALKRLCLSASVNVLISALMQEFFLKAASSAGST